MERFYYYFFNSKRDWDKKDYFLRIFVLYKQRLKIKKTPKLSQKLLNNLNGANLRKKKEYFTNF